uniref:uncharacterized protein LOC122597016 n=1 Tax=Erigeron canadensis TaxID=72917 RepID=UPI001CB8C1D3|nr:uncharacterized protein LOC122597016 [Erigeron canadensis]
MAMCFVNDPMFEDDVLRTRYRMSKRLFLKIVEDITTSFSWFQDSVNVAGIRGFSLIQKCTCALRQLEYDNLADLADNYDEGLSFSTRTPHDCLDNFFIAIKHLYGEEYLCSLTTHDVARLYEAHETKHHFPGMIGSMDWSNNDINVLMQSSLFIPEVNGKSLEYGFCNIPNLFTLTVNLSLVTVS